MKTGVGDVVPLAVAETAEMSPMCSIMAAMAMGAITRMEVRSNFASTKGGRPTAPTSFAPEKSTTPMNRATM